MFNSYILSKLTEVFTTPIFYSITKISGPENKNYHDNRIKWIQISKFTAKEICKSKQQIKNIISP